MNNRYPTSCWYAGSFTPGRLMQYVAENMHHNGQQALRSTEPMDEHSDGGAHRHMVTAMQDSVTILHVNDNELQCTASKW